MTKAKEAKKTQKQRFIETAKAAGCDESEEAFGKTFEKIVPPKTKGDKPKPSSKP